MQRVRAWVALGVLITVIAGSVTHSSAAQAGSMVDEFSVPSDTPGISLYMRERRLPARSRFASDHVILFVHGSTYPAETSFDLPIDGISWMDYIASRGYDVYLLDIRGYGRSTRPSEMLETAASSGPIVRTDVATRDVATAVDFIRERRHVAKIVLLGWSWGTTMMGSFTAMHPDKVEKLIQLAPQWVRTTAPTVGTANGALPAYRIVDRETARMRWIAGVPEAERAHFLPESTFDAWWNATVAGDPLAKRVGGIAAPNGTVQDTREFWSSGRPYYDPSKITVPVLIAHAAWDADLPMAMAHTYFDLLTGAPAREYVEIPGGTHTIMLEPNRDLLFAAVQRWLDTGQATPRTAAR